MIANRGPLKRYKLRENRLKSALNNAKCNIFARNSNRSQFTVRTVLTTPLTTPLRGHDRRKKAPHRLRGSWCRAREAGSGSLRQAAHFGDGGLAVHVLVQHFACIADAGATHGAHAQFLAQLGDRRDAQLGRLADFTVGDVIADTDDHWSNPFETTIAV